MNALACAALRHSLFRAQGCAPEQYSMPMVHGGISSIIAASLVRTTLCGRSCTVPNPSTPRLETMLLAVSTRDREVPSIC